MLDPPDAPIREPLLRLQTLPHSLRRLSRLQNLLLTGCKVDRWYATINGMSRLHKLDLSQCDELLALPDSLCDIGSIHDLNLSCCTPTA